MKKLTLALVALLAALYTQSAQARIDKEDRVLLVVSELQVHGPQNLRPLYTVIEDLTEGSTNAVLHDDYRQVHYLKRSDATLARFKNKLQSLSKDPSIKAIDVILSLHGAAGKLYFRDGAVSVSSLVSQLTATSTTMTASQIATMKRKLRMIYNLSCFGKSHNAAFNSIGFDVSVGSRGINANSEVEYVPALTAWSFGWKFQDAFNGTNSDVSIAAADAPVRLVGIPADSKKIFSGSSNVTISSDPR